MVGHYEVCGSAGKMAGTCQERLLFNKRRCWAATPQKYIRFIVLPASLVGRSIDRLALASAALMKRHYFALGKCASGDREHTAAPGQQVHIHTEGCRWQVRSRTRGRGRLALDSSASDGCIMRESR